MFTTCFEVRCSCVVTSRGVLSFIDHHPIPDALAHQLARQPAGLGALGEDARVDHGVKLSLGNATPFAVIVKAKHPSSRFADAERGGTTGLQHKTRRRLDIIAVRCARTLRWIPHLHAMQDRSSCGMTGLLVPRE